MLVVTAAVITGWSKWRRVSCGDAGGKSTAWHWLVQVNVATDSCGNAGDDRLLNNGCSKWCRIAMAMLMVPAIMLMVTSHFLI